MNRLCLTGKYIALLVVSALFVAGFVQGTPGERAFEAVTDAEAEWVRGGSDEDCDPYDPQIVFCGKHKCPTKVKNCPVLVKLVKGNTIKAKDVETGDYTCYMCGGKCGTYKASGWTRCK